MITAVCMEITIIKIVKAITDSRKASFCFRFRLLSMKLLFCLLCFLTLLRIVGVEVSPPWETLGAWLSAVGLGIHYVAYSLTHRVMRDYFIERFRLKKHKDYDYDWWTVICCPICAACQMHSELEYQITSE